MPRRARRSRFAVVRGVKVLLVWVSIMAGLAIPSAAVQAEVLSPVDLIDGLAINNDRPGSYERTEWSNSTWGPGDIAGDNCDVRCELLNATQRPDGTWFSRFDPDYVSSNPSDFDIDHVVAVVEAHRSGGQYWSPERKAAFYNDKSNLVVLRDDTNDVKSDNGPTTDPKDRWLPDTASATCDFVEIWIRTKAKWDLTVDEMELGELYRIADECGWDATPITCTPNTAPVATDDRLSTESGRAVWRLYQAYFQRNPDEAGFNYWLDQHQAGESLARISEHFAASSEFEQRFGSPGTLGFVRIVYRNVMCRLPDSEGMNYWVDQMDRTSLTRGELMLNFSDSTEFRTRTRS